jgi:hypothetical protein
MLDLAKIPMAMAMGISGIFSPSARAEQQTSNAFISTVATIANAKRLESKEGRHKSCQY